jgi:hypothetical protein
MSMSVAAFAGRAWAGPWNIEPSVGVAADYESNPGLRTTDPQAEENVAAIIDFPLRYDVDEFEWTLRPSGRLSNRRGYDSLASDYVHVDTSAQYTSELSSVTLQGDLARDSSLLFIGPGVNGLGVRRDTAATSADWTQIVTERQQVQLDASWSEVKYALPSVATYLVNYRYFSGGPTWSFQATERSKVQLNASAGQYDSLNGITSSRSYSPQLTVVRQLTEIWSLTAAAGYSRAINSEKFYFGPFYLGSFKAAESSTTYTATLVRQGERLNLSVGASRGLTPTGFAYLSQLENVTATASFTQSEYWTYRMTASWQRAVNPVLRNEETTQHYVNAGIAADWHWTPQWTMSFGLGRVSETYGPPRVAAASNAATITVTRQFLRTEL